MPLEVISDRARQPAQCGPHTLEDFLRKSSSLRNLSGLLRIAWSILRSSASSNRSSRDRYSSISKMTAAGLPPRITISGSVFFFRALIVTHLISVSYNISRRPVFSQPAKCRARFSRPADLIGHWINRRPFKRSNSSIASATF